MADRQPNGRLHGLIHGNPHKLGQALILCAQHLVRDDMIERIHQGSLASATALSKLKPPHIKLIISNRHSHDLRIRAPSRRIHDR